VDFLNKQSFYFFWRKEYILRNHSFQEAWRVFEDDPEGTSPGYDEKTELLKYVHFLPKNTAKAEAEQILYELLDFEQQGSSLKKSKDAQYLWNKAGMFLGGGLPMKSLSDDIQSKGQSVTVDSFFERDIRLTLLELEYLYWDQHRGKETESIRAKRQTAWEKLIDKKIGKASHWPRVVGLWLWDKAEEIQNKAGAVEIFLNDFCYKKGLPETWLDEKALFRALAGTNKNIKYMDVLPMR
jgi:hypothetical protein